MIRQWKKWMMMTGVLCVLCFGISGCGDKNTAGSNANEEDVAAPATEDENVQDRTEPEGEAEPGAEDGNASGKAQDSEADLGEPDLIGDIKEIDGMQFTVVEAKTKETEDGDIIIAPSADGDDSDFAKVVVVCDEDTVFYTRTIYDGGERHEDSDAVIGDLAVGSFVDVWGSYEEDVLHAKTIQITEVVF